MKNLAISAALLACSLYVLPARAADSATPPAPAAPVVPGVSGVSGVRNAAEHQVLVMLHMPAPHFRPDANYGGRYGGDSGHAARRAIAEELAQTYGLIVVNDWPMPALGIDCYVMEDPAGDSAIHLAELLSRDPRAEWVQPMSQFHGLGNDGAADPLAAVQPAARLWHLDELHRVTTGRNVRVAVVDSGVEDDHPDLRGQVSVRENFVDTSPYAAEAHGTAVAGIIAAVAGNGIGIEGVAPGARLMALRACWQETGKDGGKDGGKPGGKDGGQGTSCNSFTLGKALNFAILHDAQVINLSLGGPPDRLLQRLLEAAQLRGIKVVAAVDPQRADGGFPASLPGVLAVRGLDAGMDAGLEANMPGRVVLLAPGRDIPTTAPGARWGFVSGSSYAAAHVSGMVALMTELQPRASLRQLREDLSSNGNGASTMAIDACATIGRITGNCPCSCATANASKQPIRLP